MEKAKRYMWKNKRVSEKIYRARLAQCRGGAQRGGKFLVRRDRAKHPNTVQEKTRILGEMATQALENIEEAVAEKPIENINQPKTDIHQDIGNHTQAAEKGQGKLLEGRRIVELLFLGRQLWCTHCKECLSLENVKNETRQELASVLIVRCHKCLILNSVISGKQHTVAGTSKRDSRFDVNTKLATALMHSGIGFTNFSKFLACLNMPQMHFKTYKRYEAEAGAAIESTAKESCERAVELERQLTVQNPASL